MHGNTFDNLPPDKRERVFEAAAEEFAAHGFHQASMNRVVRSLGIAKGSLFKYFGTKEGLFERLFDDSLARIKGPLKQAAAGPGGFFARLRAVMLAGLAFIDAHPRLYRIYLKLLFQENAPLRARIMRTMNDSMTGFLRPLIEQGVSEGELAPELDVDMAVFTTQSLLERFLQAARIPGVDERLLGIEGQEAGERIDALINQLRRGLGPGPGDTKGEPAC